MGKKKAAKKAATAKSQKSFEQNLWDTADKLRGTVESSEYKHVVLSLIFLKFVSDKFEKRKQEADRRGPGRLRRYGRVLHHAECVLICLKNRAGPPFRNRPSRMISPFGLIRLCIALRKTINHSRVRCPITISPA